MADAQETLRLVEQWWQTLDPIKKYHGLPAKGTVAGALAVLDRLKTNYTLDIDDHRAKKGKSQIGGAGPAATRRILAEFGETRKFLEEGGRTNRGLAGDISSLLDALRSARLDRLPLEERVAVLTEAQRFLVDKAALYFSQERIKFPYTSATTAWEAIHSILQAAKDDGKEAQAAQYLVGAKLAVRFPDIPIRNDLFSTADVQSGSPGDFTINDTTFHVTIAPNSGHYEKCQRNILDGYSVYLLVPERIVVGVRQYAESQLTKAITTQSIEAFVSQNLDEIATFSRDRLASGLRQLLETYNERVDEIESDKALMIEIPRSLAGR